MSLSNQAVLAGELDLGPGTMCRRGSAGAAAELQAQACPEPAEGTELALEMLARALERGHLEAKWVAADDAFDMSPSFRESLSALRVGYVLDVPAGFTVRPVAPEWTSPVYRGRGAPPKPRLKAGAAPNCRGTAWQEITVAQGSQGTRSDLFSAQRVRPTNRRKPGEVHWAVCRRNHDSSEPRYYPFNTPEDTSLETLAQARGSRWRIDTEFETAKSDVGMDEYETRTPYQVLGRLCACWPGPPC